MEGIGMNRFDMSTDRKTTLEQRKLTEEALQPFKLQEKMEPPQSSRNDEATKETNESVKDKREAYDNYSWKQENADGWKPDGGDTWKPDDGDEWKPDGGDAWEPDDGDGWKPDGGDTWKPDDGDGWKPDGGDTWKPDDGVSKETVSVEEFETIDDDNDFEANKEIQWNFPDRTKTNQEFTLEELCTEEKPTDIRKETFEDVNEAIKPTEVEILPAGYITETEREHGYFSIDDSEDDMARSIESNPEE
jgi:hypothetical protein